MQVMCPPRERIVIVTLCGSGRFEPWFHMWIEALGHAGHPAFGLSSYPSMNGGVKDHHEPERKVALDKLHFAKIAASDAILVLNVMAYIGESTMNELREAERLGKRIFMLESWGKGLGIGGTHYEFIRRAARRFGVWGMYSPIDTMHYRSPFDGRDLLGPGGGLRHAIVARLREREADALGLTAEERAKR